MAILLLLEKYNRNLIILKLFGFLLMFVMSCNRYSLFTFVFELFQSSLLDYVSTERLWLLSTLTTLFLSPLFMGRIRRVWPQTETGSAATEVRVHGINPRPKSEDFEICPVMRGGRARPQAEGVYPLVIYNSAMF